MIISVVSTAVIRVPWLLVVSVVVAPVVSTVVAIMVAVMVVCLGIVTVLSTPWCMVGCTEAVVIVFVAVPSLLSVWRSWVVSFVVSLVVTLVLSVEASSVVSPAISPISPHVTGCDWG